MHVVLADDHDLIRDGLRAHVSALAAEVGISEASSCDEVLALAGRRPLPDLILLDLDMPGMDRGGAGNADGMEGVRRVTSAFPGVPVVIVSGYSDSGTVAGVLRNGARGFVSKTDASKTLLRALDSVLKGHVYVPEKPTIDSSSVWPPRPAEGSRDGTVPSPSLRVSAREATVLQLLSRGLTNKEIALQLGLKEITVKVHLQHAYRKIGAANRADAVRIVLGLQRSEPAGVPGG